MIQAAIMTQEQAEDRLGKVILNTNTFVVRATTRRDGELVLRLHRVENGSEILPRGYVVGGNYLSATPNT